MTVTVGDVIDNVATHYGVPTVLARADAWQESGCIADRVQEGVPLSEAGLGLFQLTPGGELGDLTEAEAFNPAINCETALSVFAGFKAQDPSLEGGEWAAAAQRPEFPVQYAADVNSIIAMINAGTMPAEYEQNCAAPAGVPLPYPPAPTPTPPEVTDMEFIAEGPSSTASFLYDTQSKTRRGLSEGTTVTALEAVGIKNYGATLNKSFLALFTAEANFD